MDEMRLSGTAERRRETRIELLGGEISLCPGDGPEIPVITSDLSLSGMSVISAREIVSGTSVSVRGDSMGEEMRRATVLWCRRIDEGVFKAGLFFS